MTISGRATLATASGSTADAKSRSPSICRSAARTRATVWTPSTPSISSATDDEKAWPTALDTTKSATMSSASVWSRLALADAPSTDIIVTRATPIISADAVAAVRRGLRRAFCSAIRPTAPKERR